MRVILDECLPRKIGNELVGHEVTTVPQEGLAGVVNGMLLKRLHGRCDAFVTVDKSLPAQQNTAALPFGIVVLRARSNRLKDLRSLIPDVLAALEKLQPGQVTIVAAKA